MKKMVKLNSEMLYSWTGWSAYEGREFKGWPIMTIIRGKVIAEWKEGDRRVEIVGKPSAEYIPRKLGHQMYPISNEEDN
jgi:dihydropyrimidinase/dihydroorotase